MSFEWIKINHFCIGGRLGEIGATAFAGLLRDM